MGDPLCADPFCDHPLSAHLRGCECNRDGCACRLFKAATAIPLWKEPPTRKVIYLAHPLGQEQPTREENRRNAAKWVAWAADQGVSVVADWIILAGEWTEDRREEGLKFDLGLVERCDELWLCGLVISPGMAIEAEHARLRGIPIVDKTGTYEPPRRIPYVECMACHKSFPRDKIVFNWEAARIEECIGSAACPHCRIRIRLTVPGSRDVRSAP